jgi:putative oxidoreductase
MEIINQYHQEVATLLARVFLGLLFFFQGYDAVFNIKISNVINAYQDSFRDKGIPRSLTVIGAWFTSYTELICGAFLILGLFEYPALYLLGLNIAVASLAFSINTPMWDLKHVFPRLVFIVLLLLVPGDFNLFSLDHLIFNCK